MKINAVIFKKDKFKDLKYSSEKRKKLIFLTSYLSVFVLIGILMFLLHKDKTHTIFNECFREYIQFIKEKSKPEVFAGLLTGNLFYFILVLFFTFNLLGKPFIYIISGLKISGLSAIVAYLYYSYQIKGIEYTLLVLLPGKLLLIFAIILMINLTSSHIDEFIKRNCENKTDIGINLIKLLFIFLIIMISTAVDTLTAVTFSELFQL